VNNTNLQPISYSSGQIIALDKVMPIVNALVLGNLCEFRHRSHTAKNEIFWLRFCRRHCEHSFQPFWCNWPEPTEFGTIMQNSGHYAVQGHSMSPTLVTMETSYVTFY